MMECKKALQENAGDMEKSEEYLRVKGIAKAGQRAGKQTSEGLITSYIHHNGKVGVMVEINCETDFVARTDDFKQLGRELALHIASAAPLAVDRDGIPEDTLVVERRIAEEQAKASGKPEAILKISGEALAGGRGTGFDFDTLARIAGEIKQVLAAGASVGLVIGGGNIVRGAQFASVGMDRVGADYMGMLGTVINALAMQDVLERAGVETRVMTAI